MICIRIYQINFHRKVKDINVYNILKLKDLYINNGKNTKSYHLSHYL